MAKFTRLFHKIFGISANFSTQMGKYGSLKNGSPEFAANAEEIQSLGNFEGGLYDAIIGNNSPAIQDINGVLHHSSRQIGYLFQNGVPEWDTQTTYFQNSFCTYGNILYYSLVDNNLNQNPASQPTKWAPYTYSFGSVEKTGATGTTVTFPSAYVYGENTVFFRNGMKMRKVASFSAGSESYADEYKEVDAGAASTQITLHSSYAAEADDVFSFTRLNKL